MLQTAKTALMVLIIFSVITGFVYPMVVTGIASIIMPFQAKGSIIVKDGMEVGSLLIGQPFSDPGYFWPRPSATQPFPYNSALSSGTNLAQGNPDLIKRVKERIKNLIDADPENNKPVPIDLVTASGSGLDPHISPASAEYQIRRVARARSIDEERLRNLVAKHSEKRLFGLLGEPRVNVLQLNLAIDDLR